MLAAGLLAKKAVDAGLQVKPWVKTSLAPGSRVVTDYLDRSGLQPYLDKLGFELVGYGCTTCIGNSGPLPEDVGGEVDERRLVVTVLLSGTRDFDGRAFRADELWAALSSPSGPMYEWGPSSTYVREPPFFEGLDEAVRDPGDITGARVLERVGDSITTDHISPAGSIKADSPAGRW